MFVRSFLPVACVLTTFLAPPAGAAPHPPRPDLTTTALRVPLAFEANHGQVATDVRFMARGPGYTMFLTPAEIVMRLQARATPAGAAVVRMRYAGVYPGIDAAFYGDQQQPEYDLVVAPGGDPAPIVRELIDIAFPPGSP